MRMMVVLEPFWWFEVASPVQPMATTMSQAGLEPL